MRSFQHPFGRRFVAGAVLSAALMFPLGVLASHGFTDVLTSNTFHADIEAIADAGVTMGCAVDKYCPSDYVTREQMAAFLNRLGALAPGKTPVVNADRVDGLQANDLTRMAHSTVVDTLAQIPKDPAEIAVAELAIMAPRAGFVMVNTSTVLLNSGCTQNCVVNGHLHHVEGNADSQDSVATVPSLDATSLYWTTVFHVQPGENHFELKLTRWPTSDGTQWHAGLAEMTAIFSPFEDNGLGG